MRKLGFVSAILADLELEDVFKVAVECGYDAVELMCWPRGKAERRYAGVTHIDVDTDDPAQITALCEKYGITITGLGYYPNLLSTDPDEAARCKAHLEKVIAYAPKIDVDVVNTFIGRDPKKSITENWPAFLAIWPGIIAHAEACNIKIGIENCPMLYTGDEWPGGKNLALSPSVWRRMFAAIPSAHFGLNYDPSHLVWQFMDYLAPIQEFGGRFVHLHAKDVRLDREKLNSVGILAAPLEYHLPKLPGLGEIDWTRFFSVLSDSPYKGPIVVEVEDRAYEGSLESRKAALKQTARFLRNFL
ncbi:sugar phosphate isomerase/epimerase family protein [Armatimonas sp.]|uniref:sugar phosphate isomerase/epimerase family protein n=1 Tax=Armatimonas sp. TaxID=1872638 RepID=UPI00374D712A